MKFVITYRCSCQSTIDVGYYIFKLVFWNLWVRESGIAPSQNCRVSIVHACTLSQGTLPRRGSQNGKFARSKQWNGYPVDLVLGSSIARGRIEAYKTAIPLFSQLGHIRDHGNEVDAYRIANNMPTTEQLISSSTFNNPGEHPLCIKVSKKNAGLGFVQAVQNSKRILRQSRIYTDRRETKDTTFREQLKYLRPWSFVETFGNHTFRQRLHQLRRSPNPRDTLHMEALLKGLAENLEPGYEKHWSA